MITNNPLILNITNHVTTHFVASSLIALGASPVMSDDPYDAFELVAITQGACLNIGTISSHQMEVMRKVLSNPNAKNIVLDPVGSGASTLRSNSCKEIIASGKVKLIRGNASEISSLAGLSATTRGVDSTMATQSVESTADDLAKHLKCIIVVSGETDYISNGIDKFRVNNGVPIMAKITGTGCVLSSYLAAILASVDLDTKSIATAVAFYGLLGEKAEIGNTGLGNYRERFLDAMSTIRFDTIQSELKITKL
ncbi:MAG: hydroxyethylthiazole kinase [Leptospira sp.]|nr:hydroxyethylthiazole kinase [Leptospira sp.]